MQAAIDRVLRSFSLKPTTGFDNDTQRNLQRHDAEALADRLLKNFTGQLAHNASQRH